jgi:ethanolamine transporter EutH
MPVRQEYIGVGQLALVFAEIAVHRKGPDALPASAFLFGLVLVAYFVVSLMALSLRWPLWQAFGAMVVDVAVYLAFFAAVLRLTGHRRRFLQTVTAVLGAETFLSCLALPLLLTRPEVQSGAPTEILATSLLFALLIWSVDIGGFVLAKALDRSYIVGVSVMIGYVVGSMLFSEFLFPSPS